MTEVRAGDTYKHFKGRLYEVVAVARDSEDLKELVVYRGLYDSDEFGPNPIWVRPKDMFLETIERDGKVFPRFELISST